MDMTLIYDVGLHKGEDSAFYLRKGYRVIAFEADPAQISHCQRRFRSFLNSGQLVIVEGAIAPPSCGETVTFYKSSVSVWGTIDPEWKERNRTLGATSESIVLPRIDFKSALDTYGIPGYIKVDIEGADRHVLTCLRECDTPPQYISIESEKTNWTKLVEELDILSSLGYREFRAVQQASYRKKKLTTTSLSGEEFTYTFERHSSGPFGTDLKQPWLDRDAFLRQCKVIFRNYELLGDRSPLRRNPLTRLGLRISSFVLNRPLPGWYDTHARL